MVTRPTRREALALGGAAVVGAVAGGFGVGALRDVRTALQSDDTAVERVTLSRWRETRQTPYHIGHRGIGDVAPEHTLPSYQGALDAGARCLEISVVRSADDVLYCLHDLSLQRTTTGRGRAASYSADTLDAVRVSVRRLGPRWVGGNMPPLPRLADVLAAIGGRAALCLEAKDDDAYPAMVKLVEHLGLQDTVMIKLNGRSPRLKAAQDAGYPVFAYLANEKDATARTATILARKLDPSKDALVLPARINDLLLAQKIVVPAVDAGVPVWVFPVHRRSEMAYFAGLGVEGMVTPDVSYLNGTAAPVQRDSWASGISAGELTRNPYSDSYGLGWEDGGVVTLGAVGHQAFLMPGQFCPIPATSYRLTVDVSFDPLPHDTWQHLSIAFGHRDDRYYEHRLGTSDGYHALLRANGNMAIYAHAEGEPDGQQLTKGVSGKRMRPGAWSRLTLDITPDAIRWSRDDGTSVELRDARFRGGYFHIGRSSNDGVLKLRQLSIA